MIHYLTPLRGIYTGYLHDRGQQPTPLDIYILEDLHLFSFQTPIIKH